MNLFVYGTLMFPDVLTAVLGRVPPLSPVTVDGWRVAALPGRRYPGLVPSAGSASGLLLDGLTDADMRILDAFEGDSYVRAAVGLPGGGTVPTYLWADLDDVLPADWDPAGFLDRHLTTYSRDCAAWRTTL